MLGCFFLPRTKKSAKPECWFVVLCCLFCLLEYICTCPFFQKRSQGERKERKTEKEKEKRKRFAWITFHFLIFSFSFSLFHFLSLSFSFLFLFLSFQGVVEVD